MLARLPESGRLRTTHHWSGAFSLLAHGAIIGVAVLMTRREPPDSPGDHESIETIWAPTAPSRRAGPEPDHTPPLPRVPVIPVPGPAPIPPPGGIIPIPFTDAGTSAPRTGAPDAPWADSARHRWNADERGGGAVITSREADEPPVLLRTGLLVTPPGLDGVDGRVVLDFVIDRTGAVEPASIRVVEHSDSLFDGAARTMVLHSRYRPGRLDGRPVRVRVRQGVRFR